MEFSSWACLLMQVMQSWIYHLKPSVSQQAHVSKMKEKWREALHSGRLKRIIINRIFFCVSQITLKEDIHFGKTSKSSLGVFQTIVCTRLPVSTWQRLSLHDALVIASWSKRSWKWASALFITPSSIYRTMSRWSLVLATDFSSGLINMINGYVRS